MSFKASVDGDSWLRDGIEVCEKLAKSTLEISKQAANLAN